VQCPDVVERLPELLNGSLPPDVREEVQSHISACLSCLSEWNETRLGAAVLGGHLPTDAIVALAWDRPLGSLDMDLAQQHVSTCPECAIDLALARESRLREEQTTLRPRRGSRRFVPAALAAGAAVLAFGTGISWEAARSRRNLAGAEAERRETAERLSITESALERARDAESQLRADLDRVRSPQLNLPILELLPGSSRARQAGTAESVLTIRSDDVFVALVLSVSLDRPLTAELRNDKGVTVWKGAGLRPSPLGGYTIGIPAALLPEGRFSLALVAIDGHSPVATLPFAVRRVQ
jgi:hypothetical protein